MLPGSAVVAQYCGRLSSALIGSRGSSKPTWEVRVRAVARLADLRFGGHHYRRGQGQPGCGLSLSAVHPLHQLAGNASAAPGAGKGVRAAGAAGARAFRAEVRTACNLIVRSAWRTLGQEQGRRRAGLRPGHGIVCFEHKNSCSRAFCCRVATGHPALAQAGTRRGALRREGDFVQPASSLTTLSSLPRIPVMPFGAGEVSEWFWDG